MHHRKSLVVLVALVLVVVAAGGAFASSLSANGPVQNRVYGGGRIPVGTCSDGPSQFCTQVTREFSLFAVSSPQGGGAYGTVTFGNVEHGGPVYAVRVTCLAVSGNLAEIGGVVVDSADPTAIGGAFRVFVRDSGTPGSAARDGVSPLFPEAPPAQATCGDLSTGALGSGYFALASGDVVVEGR